MSTRPAAKPSSKSTARTKSTATPPKAPPPKVPPRRAAHGDDALAAFREAFAYIEFTPDGTVVDANDAFLQVMGYTRDEVVGRHHRTFVTPAYAASSEYGAFWKRLRAGEPFSGEIHRVAKGGADRWLTGSYVPMCDARGVVTRVVKLASDVTAAHRAAERDAAELASTLRRATGEMDAMRNAFASIEFTPDGTILAANDAFLRVMGYARDEVIGKHHRMFAPPGFADTKEYADLWEGLRAGRAFTAEIHRMAKGGVDRWLNGSYIPLPDGEGRIVRVIKLASDVTDAHLTAERDAADLTTSLRRADAVTRASGFGVWEITVRNGESLSPRNTVWYSTQFAKLLGHTDTSRLRTDVNALTEFMHPDDRDGLLRQMAAHADDRTGRVAAFDGECRFRTADGGWRWFRATGTAERRNDGTPTHLTGAIKDVHVEKEALLGVDRTIGSAVEGDLTKRLDATELTGPMRRMADNLNRLLDVVSEMVRTVKIATQQVSEAAVQLGSTSQLMSDGAGQLSQGVESATDQLRKVSAGVQTNAQSAAMANQLVSQTATAARSGDARMTEMNAAMGAIHTSAQQIAKIIKVIDEIAFQTNLLALNAAVEAARAGRHGRGFAVVAQEVRSLAERSARAAKETTDLIADSVNKVGEGVRIAQSTREALQEITHNVEKVVDLVAEVSTASDEQSLALSTVAAAVQQVSEGTQGASQQSTEVAAAAEELNRQMRVLKDQMDRYTVAVVRNAHGRGAGAMKPELFEQIAVMLRSGDLEGVTTLIANETSPAPHRAAG